MISTKFFTEGAFVYPGKPYHPITTFDDMPLYMVKNAGKMVGRKNIKGVPIVLYYLELDSEVFHGTRREYAYYVPDMPESDTAASQACTEFEDQFPVFPYNAHKYHISQLVKKIDELSAELAEVKARMNNNI